MLLGRSNGHFLGCLFRKASSPAQFNVELRSLLPSIVSVNLEVLWVVAQFLKSFLVTLSPLRVGSTRLCSIWELFWLHIHREVVRDTSYICRAEWLLLRTQCLHYAYMLETKRSVVLQPAYSFGAEGMIYFHPKKIQLIWSETILQYKPKHTKW